jgi:hypothetical protein
MLGQGHGLESNSNFVFPDLALETILHYIFYDQAIR